MSSCSCAWVEATKLAARVTSSSTKARQSWYVGREATGASNRLTNGAQLDAGMHPAHEGLSAMPFYDDFDLSTVDVLLISQYVYACFVSQGQYSGGGNMAHHRSRAVHAQIALPDQRHLVYQNQWNIICILPARLR
jgi:hypothetical protein